MVAIERQRSSSDLRVIAIDWSGAKSGARRKIWLAEARGGRDGGEPEIVRLECGRSRREMERHLLEEAEREPELIVGLDFAFSLPAWFLREHELTTARELWQLAAREAETWLERCEPPFWGRPGKRRPALPSHFRRTDADVLSVGGVGPKSPFQVTGAGSVGTGTLRGMPLLRRLSDADWRIWPFDAPDLPLVIEIYPRLLMRAVVKSSHKARAQYLAWRFPELTAGRRRLAASSEDAFDAAVSALELARHAEDILDLEQATDPVELLEGRIWLPGPSEAVLPKPSALGTAASSPLPALLSALEYAAEKHRDQRRKGPEASPYINHPISVARVLAEIGDVSDPILLQAAILHDTIEDTRTTPDELERSFGAEVRALVEEVTDDKSLPKKVRKQLQIEHAPGRSPRAKQLKIADKISNIADIIGRPPTDWTLERKREYLDWAERVVAGCRGANRALEECFDRKLREAREAVG